MKKHIKLVLVLSLILVIIGGITVFFMRKKADSWELLSEAYEYTFPLVLMHASEEKMTNTVEATNLQAPNNQFIHAASLATAASKDVVTPNVDTVYSQVWLDLKDDAVVFQKPATDRYCSFAILDAYTNCVTILGTGGDGQDSCTYLFTGPDYQGEIPAGMTKVSLPTNMGWIIGRTLCNGPDDLEQVHTIQKEMWIGTLTQHQTGDAPQKGSFNPDLNGIPLERVLAMTPTEFFTLANQLMIDNPPTKEEAPLMKRLSKINVGPGLNFDPTVLGANAAQQWKYMLSELRTKLVKDSEPYLVQNGIWSCYGEPIAEFGTAYSYRSLVALAGLGANPVSVAVYPKALTDSNGERLNGSQCYVLRFEADMLPPVKELGFWSITAYDSANDLLIENEIERYCINDRSNLTYKEDGSLEIYIQSTPPSEEHMNNWLPVCEGEFHLHLRIYLPEDATLNGQWTAPSILPVDYFL